MAAHKKDKILCRCSQCGTEKSLVPSLAKRFKFCSNKCKWKASRKLARYNKLPESQYTTIKCANELCGKIIKLLPGKAKGRKYCSRKCKFTVESKQYPELIQANKQKEVHDSKRQIWFLR